jgi:hypothetical protein
VVVRPKEETMRINGRVVVIAAAVVVALAAAGAGIAQAVSGGEESVMGPAADRAGKAALAAVGGGTVLEVEREDGDGAGVYEVEVRRADGSQVEVHLDAAFRPLGTVADDDRGAEPEPDSESEPESDD